MNVPPELTLPAEIEAAMREVTAAAFDLQDIMGRELVDELPRVMDRLKQAEGQLRATILAALEPDRALRERAERLRRVADAASISIRVPDIVLEVLTDLCGGDLDNDLAATSSANVRRE